MSQRVAIMQPYFFPYAGYFRLFAAADLFVVLDCVQFPRRGYVHRNRITSSREQPDWLTLPLEKGDRDSTRICDLRFPPSAREALIEQFRRFPCLLNLQARAPDLSCSVLDFTRSPTDYLVENLRNTTKMLGLSRPIVLSSALDVPSELKAQDRIIEIARRVGAQHYINPPGGRALYEAAPFARAGLTLNFLSDYQGSSKSILERLLTENCADILGEISQKTQLDRVTP